MLQMHELTTSIAALARHYESGGTVADVMAAVRARVRAVDDPALFIGPLAADLDERAAALDARPRSGRGPLFGVPFVVKDNIDVAGMPTTAGCPAYARVPSTSADAVARLLDAGAVVVGKVNMDQFATGLVGTRSPYGTPRNVLDPSIVPGGSSSGSAVAVAAGVVPIALGTDTAGSGRVPAAMTQIVGLKPTRGVVSTAGVVPACASLDCVSVFAASVADAWAALRAIEGAGDDPWMRDDQPTQPVVRPDRLRLGVPGRDALAGVEPAIVESFHRSVQRLEALGATPVVVDLHPFLEAGRRLYGGAFVAERHAAVGAFADQHPADVVEPTRSILAAAASYTAVDYHRLQQTMRGLRRQTRAVWSVIDVLAVPTVPMAPSIAQVAADPVDVNARLGRFTTFANLVDLAALTVPSPAGMPRRPGGGLTLYGPSGADARLAAIGGALLGEADGIPTRAPGCLDVVVVGAHLEGEALNHELVALGGSLVTSTTTESCYRLWALSDGRRPALERVRTGGVGIDVEVWSLPEAVLGGFVSGIAPPLGLGRVALTGGATAVGFIVEEGGLDGATDITHHGGWRQHRAASAT